MDCKLHFPRAASGLATVAAFAIAAIVVAPPAHADRHCMPSLEAYYGARHAFQSDEGSCQERMDDARERLAGAQEFAAVCGCSELGNAIGDLIDAIGAKGVSCESGGARLLDFAETMDEMVQSCH